MSGLEWASGSWASARPSVSPAKRPLLWPRNRNAPPRKLPPVMLNPKPVPSLEKDLAIRKQYRRICFLKGTITMHKHRLKRRLG
ncbi:hypothetical protein PGTUg99_004485 [Puccinia graminis f. sp. tritici]|uniref:Uncharacterized protein n=1 Tax=Puccinia graminis f. sp. tritici TaxID=56615 RepID=A0A5B0RH18_PUCGR|nr:hypothetical protein PGTUg99_004485 [Puccinia graminis f. sp. tritici]